MTFSNGFETRGPAGPRGYRGANGADGGPGTPGLKGDKGDPGDPGEIGPVGVGIKGDKGDQGDQGIPGNDGMPGTDGDKGDKGDKGDQGDQGIQGVQGNPGADGAPGQDGSDGAQGAAGGTNVELYKIGIATDQPSAANVWITVLLATSEPDPAASIDISLAFTTEGYFVLPPEMDGWLLSFIANLSHTATASGEVGSQLQVSKNSGANWSTIATGSGGENFYGRRTTPAHYRATNGDWFRIRAFSSFAAHLAAVQTNLSFLAFPSSASAPIEE